jgi:hypothetical protein
MIPKFFKGITHLSDARFAAAQGFDYMGLNLDSQSGGISLADAQEILGWCSGPLLVGDFGHSPKAAVEDGIQHLQLDAAIGTNIPAEFPVFTEREGQWISPEGLTFMVFSGKADEFSTWIAENQPEGIILESLQEEKVGLRDFNDLIEILEVLEAP